MGVRKQGIFELLLIELGKVLNKALLRAGFIWARTPRAADLEWFIRGLRPVASGHDLIRVGGPNRGGYLLPDDLQGICACFSAGLSPNGVFERELARRLGVHVHVADSSVDALPEAMENCVLTQRILGLRDSSDAITLSKWFEDGAPAEGDLLLSLTNSWSTAFALADSSRAELRRCRVIVLKMHHMGRLVQPYAAVHMWPTFAKLLRDFAVVHIHADNAAPVVRARGVVVPSVLEFTLLRRDRIQQGGTTQRYPHPLDAPSEPGRKDIVLPSIWQPKR